MQYQTIQSTQPFLYNRCYGNNDLLNNKRIKPTSRKHSQITKQQQQDIYIVKFQLHLSFILTVKEYQIVSAK